MVRSMWCGLPSIAKIGAVAVCPGFPVQLAREDADLIVLHEPNPMALVAYFLARPSAQAHRLVPQRRHPAELALPALLSPVSAVRAQARRADRRVVAAARGNGAGAARMAVQMRGDSFRRRTAGRIRERGGARRRDSTRDEAAHRALRRTARALQGCGRSARRAAHSSAAAVIVGDGPLKGALEAQAQAAGMSDRVRFVGQVSNDELAALYRACDLFVLPSVTRQEAFGVVQIEAMARGKPVVSTELGTGVAWVNVHGETGLVVPPQDPVALRDAIERLLGNPMERQKMGTAAPSVRDRCSPSIAWSTRFSRRTTKSEAQVSGAKRLLDILLAGCGLDRLRTRGAHPCRADQARRRRAHLLHAGARRTARTPLPRVEIPIDDSRCRSTRRAVQAGRERSARDAHRPADAGDRDGRAAAALEHLPRRHELRRAAGAASGRDRGERQWHAWSGSRRSRDSRRAVPCVPGLTGVAQIYAPRDIATTSQVPVRPALHPPAVVLARRAAHPALVLDHVPRHLGSRGEAQVLASRMPAMQDVVIIGGGPAGLYAGARLAAAGFDTTLLEEHPAVGRARALHGRPRRGGIRRIQSVPPLAPERADDRTLLVSGRPPSELLRRPRRSGGDRSTRVRSGALRDRASARGRVCRAGCARECRRCRSIARASR